jgi:hypothetical protein
VRGGIFALLCWLGSFVERIRDSDAPNSRAAVSHFPLEKKERGDQIEVSAKRDRPPSASISKRMSFSSQEIS